MQKENGSRRRTLPCSFCHVMPRRKNQWTCQACHRKSMAAYRKAWRRAEAR